MLEPPGDLLLALVEITQFVFERGFVELDEVIHNVTDGIIGYALFEGIFFFVTDMRKNKLA